MPAELFEFINQLIVPLLVEALRKEMGSLYSATNPYYDSEAAEEAA